MDKEPPRPVGGEDVNLGDAADQAVPIDEEIIEEGPAFPADPTLLEEGVWLRGMLAGLVAGFSLGIFFSRFLRRTR
jgi:hypothetical protein